MFSDYSQANAIPNLDDLISGNENSLTTRLALSQKPGKYYKYTDAGYLLAQQLIEEQTSLGFADYINQTIFSYFSMENKRLDKCYPVF